MKKLNKDINLVVESYLGFDTRILSDNTKERLESEILGSKFYDKPEKEIK